MEVRFTAETGGEKGRKPEQFNSIPPEALFELARVYGYGAYKYEAHNFRKGYDWSWSFDALNRHLWKFWDGEDFDPESGLLHMAHVAWHALTLLQFQLDHPDLDDRYNGK